MADRDLVRKDRQSSNATSPKGTNYLLAIAINDYQHCTKLNNAVKDVEAFIQLMTSRYIFETTNVIFIKEAEATKQRIESAFDDLIDIVQPHDNLIVYFSGHGRHHERRGGFWVPIEAGQGDKDWPSYLSNALIKDYLSKIKSFHTFLIADSCFSGSLFIDKSKEKFSGDRRDTEPSRWGLTSGKKEIVSDGRPGHHSPFAAVLLDVLRKADQPLGVMRICDLVLEKVASNAEQTPMGSPLLISGHQGGQFVFYMKEDEGTAWQKALEINSFTSYTNFLIKYPNGKYKEQAYTKLEQRIGDISLLLSTDRTEALKLLARASTLAMLLPDKQFRLNRLLKDYSSFSEMVFVKGGTFQMGEDKAAHRVTLSDFLIAKHPLTFEEYDAFCKAAGRKLPSDEGWGRGKRPAIHVSWFDAIDYCDWRSQQEGLREVYQINQQQVSTNWQANGYRLPTEAEWEYAARGGQKSQGFGYAGSNQVDEVAWYRGNSGGKTQPVGQKQANELGLYDLSGNVWEWCWDCHGDYPSKASKDPKGPDTGSDRVLRGGSWSFFPTHMRVSIRGHNTPSYRDNYNGFRLARAAVAL